MAFVDLTVTLLDLRGTPLPGKPIEIRLPANDELASGIVLAGDLNEETDDNGQCAVSYTHLTLPTKA